RSLGHRRVDAPPHDGGLLGRVAPPRRRPGGGGRRPGGPVPPAEPRRPRRRPSRRGDPPARQRTDSNCRRRPADGCRTGGSGPAPAGILGGMTLARGKSVVLYGVVGAALLALAVTAYMGTARQGAQEGELLPPMELLDLAGNVVTTGDLVGKPTVLRFSSLGCSHCAEDFQWLKGLAAQYPGL